MSIVGSNRFSKEEDQILLEHWAKCQGDPRLLAEKLPNRTAAQVSQHINKSKGFKSLLFQNGFKTKSEKFEEQFQNTFVKRRVSPEITANTKTEEPLWKRTRNQSPPEYDSGDSAEENLNPDEENPDPESYTGYHYRELIEHAHLEKAEESLNSQSNPMDGCGKEESQYLKLMGTSKCRIVHNSILQAKATQIAIPLIEIVKDGIIITERTSPNHNISFSVDFLTKTLSVERTSPAIDITTVRKLAQQFNTGLLENLDHELEVKPYSASRTELVLRIPDDYELAEAKRADIKIESDTFVGFFIPKRDRIKTFNSTQLIEYNNDE